MYGIGFVIAIVGLIVYAAMNRPRLGMFIIGAGAGFIFARFWVEMALVGAGLR